MSNATYEIYNGYKELSLVPGTAYLFNKYSSNLIIIIMIIFVSQGIY